MPHEHHQHHGHAPHAHHGHVSHAPAPVAAAVLMSASTVIVAINARLLRRATL
jgi:hypothetical protein